MRNDEISTENMQALIARIDDALRAFAARELLAGGEVVDFLLDLRAFVTRDAVLRDLEVVG